MSNVKTEKLTEIAMENFEKHPSVSWYFFYNFSNENRASKEKISSLSTIHRCLKSWKDAGFLYSKKDILKRKGKDDKKGRETHNYYETEIYCLNLKPLFFYCKNKRNIDFIPEEINFLEKYFSSYIVRKRLFEFFREENFIEGLLKYYVYDMIVYFGQGMILNNMNERLKSLSFDQNKNSNKKEKVFMTSDESLRTIRRNQLRKFLRIKSIKSVSNQFSKDKKMVENIKKTGGYEGENPLKTLKKIEKDKKYIEKNERQLKEELFYLNEKMVKALFTNLIFSS